MVRPDMFALRLVKPCRYGIMSLEPKKMRYYYPPTIGCFRHLTATIIFQRLVIILILVFFFKLSFDVHFPTVSLESFVENIKLEKSMKPESHIFF